MSKQNLFVSLGHNSSAAFAIEDRVVRAYEQERIDRKKSSSAYPKDAIELALGDAGYADVTYVSHWFDKLDLESNKYLDLDHLKRYSNAIVSLESGFTHHDAHAQSAVSFLSSHDTDWPPSYVVVCDGFGTFEECFSFYKIESPANYPELVHRTHGYHLSLGLMYQYTTEFLGMKPHQDEYKLLGYEAHITRYVDRGRVFEIRGHVKRQAQEHAKRMLSTHTRSHPSNLVGNDLINLHALKVAKSKWWRCADGWRNFFPGVTEEIGVRSCVAFCAQTFLEEAVNHLITLLQGTDRRMLIVTGGVFYNVKLNRSLMTRRDKPRVFAHPLAGDQGAAMGFSHALQIDTLALGERCLIQDPTAGVPPGLEYLGEDEWVERTLSYLYRDRVVNIVRGEMEYGPRALCNTSSLAMPHRNSVARINLLNERDDAMPMAPVMTLGAAIDYLDPEEVIRSKVSNEYMITTCAFQKEPVGDLLGVAHKDPLAEIWTARPQIGSFLGDLLWRAPRGTLINTSFNYHGEPIVFTADDAIRTHKMQTFRARTLGLEDPITIIVRSE